MTAFSAEEVDFSRDEDQFGANSRVSNNDCCVWNFPELRCNTIKDDFGTCAIVVTYNPDLHRLAENLSAVAPQVDEVVVFDNASESRLQLTKVLRHFKCIYHLSDSNFGLAVALNRSCAIVRDLGASRALLLDQDSVAAPGMVRALNAELSDGIAIVAPQIIDRNKKEVFEKSNERRFVKRVITSGSLVSLGCLEAVGGFDQRLFVDWVDYDFCASMRAQGFRILQVGTTALLHEMGRREYAFTLHFPGHQRRFYRTNHSLQRQFDKARSWAILKAKHGWSRIGIEERAFILQIAIRDLVLERHRLEIIKAFLQGAREGKKVASAR